jgi:hypothetical protein
MNEQTLIQALAASCDGHVPSQADVVSLQTLSLDDLRQRAQRFLTQINQPDGCEHDRSVWVARDEHTMIQLPNGARAVVYHASGALQYVSGLAPLQGLFAQPERKDVLTRRLKEMAQKFGIHDWAGQNGRIEFEHLFQMKAQGADRSGKASEVVLSRAVGAFRHYVGDLPVLGAASVALRLAGDGQLDALAVQVRPVAAALIDKADIIPAERAARQIAQQLSVLLGQAKETVAREMVESQVMHFGYLDLGKRKSQRLLAPAFVAQVVLRHKTNRQAYVLAVPGTERPYMQIPLYGSDAVVTRARGIKPECDDALR